MSEPNTPEREDSPAATTITFGGKTYTCPYRDVMPPLTPEERTALKKDIEANGITVPILVTDQDELIDGHNRLAVAAELGLDEAKVPIIVLPGLDETAKRAKAVALNVHRRQLSREQRDVLINLLLKADPSRSDNAIAADLKVDGKTVAKRRQKLEAGKEIQKPDARRGKDGRTRPVRSPKATRSPTQKAEPRAENTPPAEESLLDAEEQTGRDPGDVPPAAKADDVEAAPPAVEVTAATARPEGDGPNAPAGEARGPSSKVWGYIQSDLGELEGSVGHVRQHAASEAAFNPLEFQCAVTRVQKAAARLLEWAARMPAATPAQE